MGDRGTLWVRCVAGVRVRIACSHTSNTSGWGEGTLWLGVRVSPVSVQSHQQRADGVRVRYGWGEGQGFVTPAKSGPLAIGVGARVSSIWSWRR